MTTYCSSSRPDPPPHAPEQLRGTQDPTQFRGGQGVVLLHAVVSRLVLLAFMQATPPQAIGTVGAKQQNKRMQHCT